MAISPFKVKAVYEYNSPHDDDLCFPNGQIITVTEEEDAEWYIGEYQDDDGEKHSGLFPRNFVERYEPAAPPRPTRRPKKEVEPSVAAERAAAEEPPAPVEQIQEEPAPASEPASRAAEQPTIASAPPKPVETKPEAKSEPVKSTPAGKPAPPPVSEKPSSFKDRIAAFNKPAAQPVAPVKPGPQGGRGSSTFIKKPFVAPPPARDSYVPPPRREPAPQKVYRREEDPEVLERQRQDQEDAEKAGLAGAGTEEAHAEGDEGAKSTSLKDRIALLQRQQQEQAARRAEAVHKEKPKKPVKKRTESSENITSPNAALSPTSPPQVEHHALGRADSSESLQRPSAEAPREVPKPPTSARRSSKPAIESPSDGNEADQSGAGETTEGEAESTEVEDGEEDMRQTPKVPSRTSTTLSREAKPEIISGPADVHGQEQEHRLDESGDEVEEEEQVMDQERRRKEELRARMAKMSGGMGMPGMFAPPMGGAKKRPSGTREDKPHVEEGESATSPPPSQRMPMVPVPGMPPKPPARQTTTEVTKEPEAGVPLTAERAPEEVPDVEDLEQKPTAAAHPEDRAAPPIPQDRPLPPPPSGQSRAAPPVPSGRPVPPPPPRETPVEAAALGAKLQNEASQQPHPAGPRSPPPRPSQQQEPMSPTSPSEKRTSRAVPPIPKMPPAPVSETRPPPPPPPTAAPPSRQTTQPEPAAEEEPEEDRESEYEGDYDTDIAPGASHRDALNKAQEREPSLDETTLSEDTRSPAAAPPPVPTAARGAPPPPPHQAPPTRPSVDIPRAPPPAPPPVRHDDDYDPYNYISPTRGVATPPPRSPGQTLQQESDPALYGEMPVRSGPAPMSPPSHDRAPPPPPPGAAPRVSREMSRKSLDPPRSSMAAARQSMDQDRPSTEQGVMAQHVDLGENSMWWTQSRTPPPIFQNRPDILYDFDESTTTKRGGRTSVSRDVYVLFPDYSQSIISARFDPKEPSEASLEQRHEPPPARLRQDQLEEAHAKLAQSIVDGASKRLNHTAADGTAHGLILDVLSAVPSALLPVGTRAYGALVYTNMANASVSQLDEIRPGDIITFRNAKFSGKHGPVHAKYSEDVGKPEHVGIVSEWDGSKKKVRAFEQGREAAKAKGKTKVEVHSSRLGDLKSGEVKVWRVMEKKWVGWDT